MRNILKIALVPVLFGAALTAFATAAAADLRINIGPPAYYYAPPPPYYYGPGPSCYWDSMAGRVCTY
jgi:hypothetical protein